MKSYGYFQTQKTNESEAHPKSSDSDSPDVIYKEELQDEVSSPHQETIRLITKTISCLYNSFISVLLSVI